MKPAPVLRRPLERVALLLLHGAPATPASGVIGVTAVLDDDDVNGRGVELSRLLAVHSSAPVALVEANLRHRSRLAAAMGMDAGPGLLDALRDPERTGDSIRPTPDPRLWVMPAGAAAPSHAPVGAARFGEVLSVVRSGTWAVARRVLDLRADEEGGRWSPTLERSEEARALVGAPGERVEGPEVSPRPFNEGPPAPAAEPEAGLAPLPRPAPPRQPRSAAVVLAPPLDAESDGDVILSQCDEVLLLVHAGRVDRHQVADAAARIGRDRLTGTILVTPKARRRS